MDFADSPEEAEFRGRLRAWLRHNNPALALFTYVRRLLGGTGVVAQSAL